MILSDKLSAWKSRASEESAYKEGQSAEKCCDDCVGKFHAIGKYQHIKGFLSGVEHAAKVYELAGRIKEIEECIKQITDIFVPNETEIVEYWEDRSHFSERKSDAEKELEELLGDG